MGNQAHGVILQFHAGLNCFMLRQQRAAWVSLHGHIRKQELMTYAQGLSQAICVTTQHPKGIYLCGLVPVLAFGMTVRSIGALAADVYTGHMTMGESGTWCQHATPRGTSLPHVLTAAGGMGELA